MRRPFGLVVLFIILALLSASTRGGAAPQESVLYSFGGIDGAGSLSGVIADASGALYGTTVFGGTRSIGTVFKLTPGSSGYTESVLYNFRGGTDGSKPFGGLVEDRAGDFFGVTIIGGGGADMGTVFELIPAGSHYRETVLYSFSGGLDGGQPIGPPVMDSAGGIYGVTQFGGPTGSGVVFKLTPSGTGYTQRVIYAIPGNADGYLPQAGLTIARNGWIYGTTYYGGDMSSCNGAGCGTVFRIAQTSSGYAGKVIYRFHGGGLSDGALPLGVPTVDNRTGDVYGTTQYGGNGCRGIGCGVVFKLSPSSAGYTQNILYSFTGKTDGFDPQGQLLLTASGKLFGTVALGGIRCNGIGCGAVFVLRPTPSGYVHRTLYNFLGPNDGADPESSGLIADTNGALYGTTRSGGSASQCADGGPGGVVGCGIVFKLVPPR
jgi:uncharacterized repeat protein (TIGR03803 family)